VLLVLLLVAVLMAQQEEQCYCCKSLAVMLATRAQGLRWRRGQKRRLLLLVLEVEAAL
jgi:hypothetical protein